VVLRRVTVWRRRCRTLNSYDSEDRQKDGTATFIADVPRELSLLYTYSTDPLGLARIRWSKFVRGRICGRSPKCVSISRHSIVRGDTRLLVHHLCRDDVVDSSFCFC